MSDAVMMGIMVGAILGGLTLLFWGINALIKLITGKDYKLHIWAATLLSSDKSAYEEAVKPKTEK